MKDNKNAVTHGAFAFQRHGEQALRPEGRTRLMELRDQVKERESLLILLQEKAADATLLFELVQSHVAHEVKMGTPLAEIPAIKILPAFFNSMQRALTTLIGMMPKDRGPLDEGKILEELKHGDEENNGTD
jgi:hypothetical protein